MRSIHDKILVKKIDSTASTKQGLMITNNSSKLSMGIILSIGGNVQDKSLVKESKVIYRRGTEIDVPLYANDAIFMITVDDIVAVLD